MSHPSETYKPLLVIAASDRPLPGRASCAYVEADGVVSQRIGEGREHLSFYKALVASSDDGIFHPRCNGRRLDALMCRLPSAGFVPGQLPTEGTWLVYQRHASAGWSQLGAVEIWSDPEGITCAFRPQGSEGRLQPFARAVRLDDEIGRMDLTDPRAWRHVAEIAAGHMFVRQAAAESADAVSLAALRRPQRAGCDGAAEEPVHAQRERMRA